MPNIMIHEQVGYFISKKLNISSYDYYLGLLAPDTPNLEGFGIKEERWTSHVRMKDLNEWKINLNNFYKKEKNNYPKDFLLGYYIHILTDIIFDDILYKKVRKEIMNDNYSKETSHDIMRDDMDKFYFNEIEEIKKILKENNFAYNILNNNKENILKWKNKQLNNLTNKNTSKYITEDIIKTLDEEVLNEINNNILNS